MMQIQNRWMIKRDYDDVLRIERQAAGQYAWNLADLQRELRQRDAIGTVAECEHVVCGFAVFRILPRAYMVVNMVVASEARRNRVGSQMVERLVDKLSQKRTKLIVPVHETNLAAQLFLQSCGLRCVAVDGETYRFVFDVTCDRVPKKLEGVV